MTVTGHTTYQDLIVESGARLLKGGIHNGRQEARWIVEHVRQARRPSSRPVPLHSTADLTAAARCRSLVERRLQGEPLQYVLRSTEFFGLELAVGPGVLIPRPETERLVDIALEVYAGAGRICDLCTGSGAIALALADQLASAACVVGVDSSEEALAYARRNAAHLRLPVPFLRGDLFAPFPCSTRFGLITANPPYVTDAEYQELADEIRLYEPAGALKAGSDGLDLIRRLAAEASARLLPEGWLVCEIGASQGAEVKAIFAESGLDAVHVHADYAERDRVAIGRYSPD